MKIVCVSMVRNEADIIELFVRHQLEYADSMIVVDHNSCDETPEILRMIRDEGAPLEILEDRRPRLEQREVTTRLVRRAFKELAADWVVPLDCDEFLLAPGGNDVRETIAELDPSLSHLIPWRSYVPTPEDPDVPHLFERIGHRLLREGTQYSKVIAPASIGSRPSISIAAGHHGLRRRRPWPLRSVKVKSAVASDLVLAHFPVRSAAQIKNKALLGWISRLASSEDTDKANFHLKRIFEDLRSGRDPSAEELRNLAINYGTKEPADGGNAELVFDPVKQAAPLRLPSSVGSTFTILTDMLEQMAEELASQARFPRGARRKGLRRQRRDST